MPSEFEFINRIRQQAAQQSSVDLICGIGDDAAIWREQANRERLITVDLLVEDVDFKLDYTPPAWLGHKTLAVSLSDIAAMGGAPKFSLLTLALPTNLKSQISNLKSEVFWEEFFAGYFALATRHGVTLIGGDISGTPAALALDSIVIGQCPAGRAVRRNGARLGDAIYVTSTLGAAAAGLRLLLDGARVNEVEDDLVQTALRAQLRPEPRVEFGRRLGESGLAHALIDVSDGLAQDLAHICAESGVGAVIDFNVLPVAEAANLVAANVDEAFTLAVGGGEDFELLFTAAANNEAQLFELAAECRLPLTRIGEIVTPEQTKNSTPLLLRRDQHLKPLSIRGYDHLAV